MLSSEMEVERASEGNVHRRLVDHALVMLVAALLLLLRLPSRLALLGQALLLVGPGPSEALLLTVRRVLLQGRRRVDGLGRIVDLLLLRLVLLPPDRRRRPAARPADSAASRSHHAFGQVGRTSA